MSWDYSKLVRLTEWPSCWGAGSDPGVQAAPPCCSWPALCPGPGRLAPWSARPCSCSRRWRPAARGRPGRPSARRRTAGAASVPGAPAAEGCQRRAHTLSFGWISPQLRPRLQSSHVSTMKRSEWPSRAENKGGSGCFLFFSPFEWMNKLGEPSAQRCPRVIRSFQKYSAPWIFSKCPVMSWQARAHSSLWSN